MSGLLEGWDWFDIGLQNVLRESGYRPLNKSQSMMVLYVSAGVQRPAEIARKMRLSRGAIRHIEKQLEEMGLITSCVDPCDRRSKILVLHDETREVRFFARDTIYKLEAALAARIGEANVAALCTVLNLDWGKIIETITDLESAEGRTSLTSAIEPIRHA